MASLLPSAAYIYVLLLNPLGLAWEYLRRDPAYRAAWRRPRSTSPAAWGVELLEDPTLDARIADPIWKSEPSGRSALSPTTQSRPARLLSVSGNSPDRYACSTMAPG